MQKLFSRSSRARFLDKQEVIGALRALARRVERKTQVEGIVLFGSIATDTYTPRSDADILIILRKDARPPRDRIPEFLERFVDAPVPVDVFPFTQAEIEKNSFLSKALRDGIDLLA